MQSHEAARSPLMLQDPLEAARRDLLTVLKGDERRLPEALRGLREQAAGLQGAAFTFHIEMGQALVKRHACLPSQMA